MKRLELAILIGLVTSIITGSMLSFAAQCGAVRGETIRLHILANSDSESDQQLKLLVRDAVLVEAGGAFGGASTKAQAVEQARESLSEITRTAEETLRQNGCADDVRAEVVNMFFTTKQYDDVVMPAGRYDAVRILIGEGKGRNWWCVMFPPMCLPAAESRESKELTEAERSLIPAEPEYKVKFAVVEAVESLREKWSERFDEAKEEKAPATAEHPLLPPEAP